MWSQRSFCEGQKEGFWRSCTRTPVVTEEVNDDGLRGFSLGVL